MNKIAWIVGRGALVGLGVGLAVAVVFYKVYVPSPEDPSISGILHGTMLASFPLGAVLALAARLPRWWLLWATGPIVAFILWLPMMVLFAIFGFDETGEALSFVPAGALGYAATTWVVSTVASWWSKLAVIGLIVTVYWLVWEAALLW
ncbi:MULTISPECIES: hypothetical protein [unclassified Nonomuraea]|uniref:hypothetical protein n=1 Tax=unclassified Nonomuraea TaxID=2593643 RepID=UPI0033F2814B